MRFYLSQFRWYRKWKGGSWVFVRTHLGMGGFWCELEEMPKCCGSHIVELENY